MISELQACMGVFYTGIYPWLVCLFSETGSQTAWTDSEFTIIALNDLELWTLQSLLPKYWDYRLMSPWPVLFSASN